jgi:hypothetical protein
MKWVFMGILIWALSMVIAFVIVTDPGDAE